MRLWAAALATLLVGACAGSSETAEPGGEVAEARDLAASMEVKVAPSSVRFILHVTNTGDAPVALNFPTSQRYDFVVESASGEEVWRWSDDMSFLQALSSDTLPPGESWSMDAVWEPEVPAGEYRAVGIVPARDRELRQETAFRLPRQ